MSSKKKLSLQTGEDLKGCLERLFPLRRCLSGPDNQLTLEILREYIPQLEIKNFKIHEKVWDWKIPEYWTLHEAKILDTQGNLVFDGMDHTLKVVSHSNSFSGKISGQYLRNKIHTHEKLIEAIPYRTYYYKDDWGFCTSQSDIESWLRDEDDYLVELKTSHEAKDMPYGEITFPGTSDEEILVSTYICHPSMANDNLSGVVMTSALAQFLAQKKTLKYTWKLIWVPETIGALAWSYYNQSHWHKIQAAIIMSTCAGPGEFTYKAPFKENHWLETTLCKTMDENAYKYQKYKFDPHGSDERQYSAPGLRVPSCSLHQSKYYDYAEYHSSLDNLENVSASQLERSLKVHQKWVESIESERFPKRKETISGEYMLGPRNLYSTDGGTFLPGTNLSALDLRLWILFYCDGSFSLSQIAQTLQMQKSLVEAEVEFLINEGMLDA